MQEQNKIWNENRRYYDKLNEHIKAKCENYEAYLKLKIQLQVPDFKEIFSPIAKCPKCKKTPAYKRPDRSKDKRIFKSKPENDFFIRFRSGDDRPERYRFIEIWKCGRCDTIYSFINF